MTPSAACDAYLACAAKATPEGYAVALQAYGPDGPCWTSESAAAQCEVACQEALENLAEVHYAVDACVVGQDVCERAYNKLRSCLEGIGRGDLLPDYSTALAQCEADPRPEGCTCSGTNKSEAEEILATPLDPATCLPT